MTSLRPPPSTLFEFFERGWRPLLAYSCGFIVAAFVVAVLSAMAFAIWKAALSGQSMPNLTGGLENFIIPAMPYLAAACGTLWGLMQQRSHEVRTEIIARAPTPFPTTPGPIEPIPADQGLGNQSSLDNPGSL